jgi:hypothetical protein
MLAALARENKPSRSYGRAYDLRRSKRNFRAKLDDFLLAVSIDNR